VRELESRNPACRKFVMSASALKSTWVRSAAALLFASTLIILTLFDSARAQDGPVSPQQVVELVATVRAAKPGEAGAPNALAVGQRLLVEQRYREAGELFSALLEKSPREPTALYGAALAIFNLGRPAEAEPLARLAADILAGPPNRSVAKTASLAERMRGADALVLLAVILGARKADSASLKIVQRAVILAPEHFDSQFTLARALYGVGDSAAAAKAFRVALKLKPDDARTLFFLATTLENAGDSAAALEAYRNLVARHPRTAEGYLGLGVLLIKRGGEDAEQGIEELKTAVGIDPNLYEAQVTLGRALLMRKLAQESVEHLRRAAELSPGNPEPHYQLALAYRRLGMNDKAVEETAIVKRIHETRRGEGAQNNNNSNNSRPEQ
jgi:tetratricopeptide (TPR) repeat protein